MQSQTGSWGAGFGAQGEEISVGRWSGSGSALRYAAMPPPFRRIALVWLLCGLALAGCRTAAVIAPTPTVTITFPAIDFGKRWLEIQTCRTACWEGVVPGLTSLSEAVDIAERHPLTDPRKTNTRDAKAGAREIWWNLGDQAQARVRIGHAVPAVADPGIVDSIVVKLNADSPITDVFSALGDPSHVEATAVMNLYLRQNMKSLSYIWAARGVAIEVANPGQATGFKPNDAADARYDRLVFFSPGPGNYLVAKYGSDYARLPLVQAAVSDWNGFKRFDFYCKVVDVEWGAKC